MKFNSLRIKLLILSGIMLVFTGGVISLIAYRISSKTLTNSVHQTLAAVADTAESRVSSINSKVFSTLKALAETSLIKSESASLDEKYKLTRSVAGSMDDCLNVTFYDGQGNSITENGKVINFATAEYFKAAMRGENYIKDPYLSPVNNMLTMFYAVPVRSDSGRIIGAVCAIFKGEMIQNQCNKITIGESDHPVIINRKTGMVLGTEESVRNIGNEKQQSIINDALSGGSGGGAYYSEQRQEKVTSSYAEIPDCDWTIVCEAPYEYYFSSLKTMGKALLFIAILFLLAMQILMGLALHFSLVPLKKIDNAIENIASGDADLTRRLNINRDDEIGSVGKSFDKFTGNLHEIIKSIKDSKKELSQAGEDLAAGTEDTANSISEIISNIDNVRTQINNQSNSVDDTAGAVHEIASNIQSLEHMIENQSEGVSSASAAVEQMIGNITSVNQNVEKMASSFDELRKSAQTGSAKQEDVNNRIEQIESQSNMLQEANAAIASIAEQTNLLAMNAAIEAAHAGEAGKGFSVVADEIRKLSETSTLQSKTIGDQLTNIKDSINSVVEASAESSKAFTTVTHMINNTDMLVQQIRQAMEEQTQGSKQISNALHDMNNSTLEVRSSSKEMAAGNQAILQGVRQLQEATGVMKRSMDEMNHGALKINETGAALSGISSKLQDSIDGIGAKIDQFKV